MKQLKKLEEILTPDLINIDNTDTIEEIITAIKNDPEWSQAWDGELYQNASFVILNLLSYLKKKYAESTNRVVREIIDPRNPENLIRESYRKGITPLQNLGATVEIECEISGDYLKDYLIIPAGFRIPAKDLNGNTIYFEVYSQDQNDSGKIDYISPIIIPYDVQTFTITGYAGNSFVQEFVLTDANRENFGLTIQRNNVIEESVRVFYDPDISNIELVRTNTFVKERNQILLPDFPNGIPFFRELYSSNGALTLLFGNSVFGGYFANPSGKTIRVYGRTGGGVVTNINEGSIDYSYTFTQPGGYNVTVNFKNSSKGSGGRTREDITSLRTYGPLRSGRDVKITDDETALIALNQMVNKHSVDSPKYGDDNKVQLLHYHNYVIPYRQMSAFNFPVPFDSDNLETYNQRLIRALTDYCNFSGIRDGSITEEVVNIFSTDSEVFHSLEQRPPLNGSIVLRAFDESGKIVDQLSFSSNYTNASHNYADLLTSKAKTTTLIPVGVTTINASNYILRMYIDEPTPGPGSGAVIEIQLDQKLYGLDQDGKASDLAFEIDQKIKQNPFYSSYVGHTFCFVESDGRISIQSPTAGEYGYIKIISDISFASAAEDIGFSTNTVKFRGYPESGLVFKSNSNSGNATYYEHGNSSNIEDYLIRCDIIKGSESISVTEFIDDFTVLTDMRVYGDGIPLNCKVISYDSNTGLLTLSKAASQTINNVVITLRKIGFELNIKINDDRINKEIISDPIGAWIDNSSNSGAVYQYSLQNTDDLSLKDIAALGSDVVVEAYNQFNNLIGTLMFAAIDDVNDNGGYSSNTGVFDDASQDTYFDRVNSIVSIKMADVDSAGGPPYTYDGTIQYDSNTYFKIKYKKKTYDYLIASYIPNPYYYTGESKGIIDRLRSTSRRMMCFEPMLKKVNTNPIKLSITITKKKTASKQSVYDSAISIIEENFGFVNTNDNMKIGTGLSLDSIKSFLLSEMSGMVEKIDINLPTQDLTDPGQNSYYFVLDRNFTGRLKIIETQYPAIGGISNKYSIDVYVI